MAVYKVQQGDYCAKIAAQNSFQDYHTIWDNSNNAQLKSKRVSPNTLDPGDILYIPDKSDKQVSRPTTQQHQFQIGGNETQLEIALHDVNDTAVSSAKGQLVINGNISNQTSGGDGLLQYDLPLDATNADLTATSPQLTGGQRHVPLIIAGIYGLDTEPFDSDPTKAAIQKAAWQDRLNNLGYFAGTNADDEDFFRWAIQEFQCEHMNKQNVSGGAPSGLCDSATVTAMRKTYGC